VTVIYLLHSNVVKCSSRNNGPIHYAGMNEHDKSSQLRYFVGFLLLYYWCQIVFSDLYIYIGPQHRTSLFSTVGSQYFDALPTKLFIYLIRFHIRTLGFTEKTRVTDAQLICSYFSSHTKMLDCFSYRPRIQFGLRVKCFFLYVCIIRILSMPIHIQFVFHNK